MPTLWGFRYRWIPPATHVGFKNGTRRALIFTFSLLRGTGISRKETTPRIIVQYASQLAPLDLRRESFFFPKEEHHPRENPPSLLYRWNIRVTRVGEGKGKEISTPISADKVSILVTYIFRIIISLGFRVSRNPPRCIVETRFESQGGGEGTSGEKFHPADKISTSIVRFSRALSPFREITAEIYLFPPLDFTLVVRTFPCVLRILNERFPLCVLTGCRLRRFTVVFTIFRYLCEISGTRTHTHTHTQSARTSSIGAASTARGLADFN